MSTLNGQFKRKRKKINTVGAPILPLGVEWWQIAKIRNNAFVNILEEHGYREKYRKQSSKIHINRCACFVLINKQMFYCYEQYQWFIYIHISNWGKIYWTVILNRDRRMNIWYNCDKYNAQINFSWEGPLVCYRLLYLIYNGIWVKKISVY